VSPFVGAVELYRVADRWHWRRRSQSDDVVVMDDRHYRSRRAAARRFNGPAIPLFVIPLERSHR
jgi:hypothetical protein